MFHAESITYVIRQYGAGAGGSDVGGGAGVAVDEVTGDGSVGDGSVGDGVTGDGDTEVGLAERGDGDEPRPPDGDGLAAPAAEPGERVGGCEGSPGPATTIAVTVTGEVIDWTPEGCR